MREIYVINSFWAAQQYEDRRSREILDAMSEPEPSTIIISSSNLPSLPNFEGKAAYFTSLLSFIPPVRQTEPLVTVSQDPELSLPAFIWTRLQHRFDLGERFCRWHLRKEDPVTEERHYIFPTKQIDLVFHHLDKRLGDEVLYATFATVGLRISEINRHNVMGTTW